MPNVLVNDDSLKAIGNAIRSKNGETTTYKPAEMATAINNLVINTGTNIRFGHTQPTSNMSSYTLNLENYTKTQPVYIFFVVCQSGGTGNQSFRLIKVDQMAETDNVVELRKAGYNYGISYGWTADTQKIKIIFPNSNFKAQWNGNDVSTAFPFYIIGGEKNGNN